MLAALALITFVNVLVRYFTDQSFAWTEEISVFLLIVLTMTGGSMASCATTTSASRSWPTTARPGASASWP